MHVKELQDKLGHLKRENRALNKKIEAFKAVKLPREGSADYQQGLIDAVILIDRAMKEAK